MQPKLAFLFPGQGSQFIGMLNEVAQVFPLVKETYHEASDVLGYDLWRLVQEGPEGRLNQTEFTQPALLAASVALWRVCQSQKIMKPLLLAGHSLGEYSALVCADALDYPSAISLVALRGRFMQEAVKEGQGAMAAIVGLDVPAIQKVCVQAAEGQVLAPANFNAIGQTVLAGEKTAVLRAITLAKEAGAKLAIQIQISVPSHCVLMKPAAEQLEKYLNTIMIRSPSVPVLTNVDVVSYDGSDQIRNALVRQLYSPVRWVEIIQDLAKQGVRHLVECGPGKILAGLNKRIDPGLSTVSIGTIQTLQEFLESKICP